MRELTLETVLHPEFIDGGTWQRVDHPTVNPIQQGAPDLGWEGDARLVVYLHLESQAFVLWRLESDGEYRPVARLPLGAAITPASINSLITRLVQIDQRRGFDPYQDVIDQQAKYDRAMESDRHDRLVDFADKLHFGLARSHMPGLDISKRVFPLGS